MGLDKGKNGKTTGKPEDEEEKPSLTYSMALRANNFFRDYGQVTEGAETRDGEQVIFPGVTKPVEQLDNLIPISWMGPSDVGEMLGTLSTQGIEKIWNAAVSKVTGKDENGNPIPPKEETALGGNDKLPNLNAGKNGNRSI